MKQLIKNEAICLFNCHGISSVSMKQIADSLDVSEENLCVHYKTKELLLACIYEDMYAESLQFSVPQYSQITLHHLYNILLRYENLQCKYTFFFKEIVYAVKNYPLLAKLHNKSSIQRFEEAYSLINYYVETERFIPQNRMSCYKKLIHSIWMIGTFWQSQQQIIDSVDYVENKYHFVDFLWNLLLPYLTEKGLEEYYEIKNAFIRSYDNTYINQNEIINSLVEKKEG
ncbi:TetR/AcrR family transcriptional regulator [Aquimarina agarivorans]|uniref:TetR/AcrR family transcriptional regulator n=1 Tax=Aquimarina agarivorans TaxID=980584 RepID=UPI000248EFF3|nr:TetR/AcrR family transcriptional regulator [Aquimarina agarivorans]